MVDFDIYARIQAALQFTFVQIQWHVLRQDGEHAAVGIEKPSLSFKLNLLRIHTQPQT